jgi:hypothetical protein
MDSNSWIESEGAERWNDVGTVALSAVCCNLERNVIVALYFRLSETARAPSYGPQIEKVCSANKNVRDGAHSA